MNVQDQPHVKMTERRSLASIRRPTQDGPVSERRADAPVPYQGFDGQYINGSWRPGRHDGVQISTNPYSGVTLAETIMANQSDFDEAYQAAAKAPSPQRRLYPKTLTVFLDASPSGKHRAIHAAALAQRWDAHVIGVHVVFAGVRLHPPSESWAIGERAFQAVIAHEKRLRAEAEAVAVHVSEHFQALYTTWNVAGELRRIDSDQPTQEAILNALHSDLVIVGHPEPNGLPDDMMLETILLASGVPLLVIPNAWLGEAIGNNVLIGWNASRKARRAISDAMLFLVDARAVATLVVDPSRGRRHGEEPGADIALQLARHNVHLNVERVMSNGSPIAEVILAHAVRSGSDLLCSEPMVTLGCGNFCSEVQREPCSRKCLSPYLFRYNSAPSADRRVFAQSESFDWGGSDAHFGTGHLEPHGRTVPTVTGRAASDRLGAVPCLRHASSRPKLVR